MDDASVDLSGWPALAHLDAVITGGERLRHWGLSEVWRVRLGGPEPRSMIVKRGTGEMAVEARLYRDLVLPSGAPAPRLIAAAGGDADPVVLVLDDVGTHTLEQRPTADGYRSAVRTLARMRTSAARWLASAPAGVHPVADLLAVGRRAADGLAVLRPDLAGALDDVVAVLPGRLERLAGEPVTLVHGDFHAKNLIHADGGIVVVDWPCAYVHAHLGDLYSLIREAGKVGLGHGAELPAVFAREAGADPGTVADHLITGGLCWTLGAVRWVVEEGAVAVPESRQWIDELVVECRDLAASG
jgi:hypothetical protein